MVSSGRQSSERSSNLTPHCQKRSCSHRDCPPRGCSRTCPIRFWCPQCTRFWCEDCWEDVDAHQPIEVGVSGMKDHEKMIPKFLHPERSKTEEDVTKRLLVAQQEQESVTPESSAAVPSLSPADQIGRDTSKEHQTGPPGSPTPVKTQLGWAALQDFPVQLMLLEQQSKKRLLMARQEQENATQRSNAAETSSSPVD